MLANDFVIQVATVNGSGSQSSNNVLVRALFRAGIPVGGKNLFPSNIQGLPTWFTIRANGSGFLARKRHPDVCLSLNPQTRLEDLAAVRPEGYFFYSSEIAFTDGEKRSDVTMWPIPFRDIVTPVSDSVKLRKPLTNMAYVGILAELIGLDQAHIAGAVEHLFEGKPAAVDLNLKVIEAGRGFVRENWKTQFPFRAEAQSGGNDGRVLIDGNAAAAVGALFGGCSFVSWYPITPSTSLVENFESLAEEYRKDKDGRKTVAVLQAEDELAAVSMAIGAGWMGARAMTATSGPGLSLMAEAAGLSYFAEIPAVIWVVQRAGPSTGLPTRTMQGDLMSAYLLSHGDAKHVVLLPGTVEECFEFGQTSFDLAEKLQTLVVALSDLDLGMNFYIAERFPYPTRPYDRGKIMTATDLHKAGTFSRYLDLDGDGIPYRTLPGTEHPLAAYFTRGTGHDEAGRYTEDGAVFRRTLDRLNKKWETARRIVPAPVVDTDAAARIGLLGFGSTHSAIAEIRSLMMEKDLATSYLRLRALPLAASVADFISKYDRTYVVEQNRDGQLFSILRMEFPELAGRLRSIRIYDGLPLAAEDVVESILGQEGLQ